MLNRVSGKAASSERAGLEHLGGGSRGCRASVQQGPQTRARGEKPDCARAAAGRERGEPPLYTTSPPHRTHAAAMSEWSLMGALFGRSKPAVPADGQKEWRRKVKHEHE